MTALPVVGGVPARAHLLHDGPACSNLSPAVPASQPSLHSCSAQSLHHLHTASLIALLKLALVVQSVPDQLLVCI